MDVIYLTITKDIAQIAFWLLAGALAILTYRQARRTVLQPIRTEVFKEQLKVMSETMSLFVGKSELPLRDDFSFSTLFDANACYLMDSYVASIFDMKFDPDQRPYSPTNCPMKILTMDPGNNSSKLKDSTGSQEEVSYSQVWVGNWGDYKMDRLLINKQYCEMNQKITRLLENPLLPIKLVELLSEYLTQAAKNQYLLIALLDQESKSLPAKFPALPIDHKVWSRELHGKYMQAFNHLKPIADEIVKFVRSYFEADNLKRL